MSNQRKTLVVLLAVILGGAALMGGIFAMADNASVNKDPKKGWVYLTVENTGNQSDYKVRCEGNTLVYARDGGPTYLEPQPNNPLCRQ